MIAVCGGLIRTGSIAMWQVMREIVLKSGGKAPKLGTDFYANMDQYINKDHITLVKTHIYDPSFDPAIEKRDIRVVVTIRDMRDVVVSLMNFNDYGFDKAIAARAFRNNPKNYFLWKEKIYPADLFIVHYEDFVLDRSRWIGKVASFLGVSLTISEATEIDRKWNIPANVERAKAKHAYNSVDYMAERHINSGKAEQWREALTQEQIDYIDTELRDFQWEAGYID